MRLCRVAIAVALLVMIAVPSWFITTLGSQMPLITVLDETLEQSPIGGTALAQNEWETSAFGNISLMAKGNFTGDEASDFIVVNGTDPEWIPVYFEEWETPTGNKIHCVNGSDGEILWSIEVNNTVTDLDVADINGDGYDEIVVSILRWNVSDPDDHNKLDNGGQLFALDRNGGIMWNHSSGQHGAYMSVIGDFNGDGHDDVAAVWTWDQMQYNVTIYTAANGTAWDSSLFTQYDHKSYYDNGTLYTGSFGYQTVPIQGVAADWDDDNTDTLILQANYDVYNETAGHELLESSTVILFHHEGNPVSIELNSTFGTATQEHGYDFNAPPMVAGDFITETGNSDWIGVVVPLNETHRVAKILNDSGSVLASKELVRAHTAWLVAADINNDGIDDLVMSDLLFDSYDGFPSPAVIAVLDGTDLEVIFEELPCTNGMQGIAALHIDVGDIDPTSDGLEILTSGMSSLVVFNATGDIVYYEAFTGVGLFSFFSDVDKDGHLEIVRSYSTWSFMQSGYTSKVSAITEFVMMIPGSLTADEWFVYSNENATVSAQFIAPFEGVNGVNVSLWNATVMPGPGYVDISLESPIVDTRLLDLTAGVPYTFEYEWNTSQLSWSQMAFTLRNETSADKAIAVFAMGGDKPSVSYTDYQDLVNKGLRWLLAEQETGGYWLAYTEYEGDEWDAPSAATTAMAVIALLNNGTISSNVTKAIDWILSQRNVTSGAIVHWAQNQTDVVETIWTILALQAYNSTLSAFNGTISETITNATEWLVSAQYQIGYEYEEDGQPETVDENSILYGAWSPKANDTEEPVDIYVTSLALAALNSVNYASSHPAEMARVFISRAQNHLYTNPIGLKSTDGGFLGIPSRHVGSMGSATGAGLFAMALSGAAEENPEGYLASVDWIHDNFILDEHVGVENYLGGLYFTRMLFITDYWFFLNLGMDLSSSMFDAAQFAALGQVVADAASPDADDTARWEAFFGEDSWRATAKCIMILQTRLGPSPTIDSPSDITYELGDTGNDLTWNPHSHRPDSYNVTRDSLSYESGDWDGSAITISIDGFAVGDHVFEITVCDLVGLTASDAVTVTVEDTTAPDWVVRPSDQIIEFGGSFVYDLDASDLSEIDSWWLNDTVIFAIDNTGVITNISALNVGVYGLEVSVNDTLGNLLTVAFRVIVQDTTAPDWIIGPSDQVIDHGERLSVQFSASDLSGIGAWHINDTVHFTIDSTGLLVDNMELAVGNYGLTVTVNDTYGNERDFQIRIRVLYVEPTTTTPTTTTETPTTTTPTTTTPTTTLPPPDYTMLIAVGAGAAAVVVIIIVLGVMRKRK